MKKAGILTFHNALSYGAVLQCCALQRFMQSCGIDNEVIDYRCDYIEKNYKKLIKIVKGKELKSFVGSVVKMGNKKKSLKLSAQFREKYLVMSKSVTRETIGEIADDYSFFVAGSDQVWSPDCAGFDTTYFLDFARPEQKRSYAASFGCKKLPEDKIGDYKRLLKDFQICSLREESGRKILEEIGCGRARVDIDPTLLLDSSQWDETAAPRLINEPYIFLFNVLKPIKMVEYAARLGKEKNLPVYWLTDKHVPVNGIKYVEPVAADGFISLIKNAEYVVTNSFHGSAFAVIYRKKLAMELETERGRNNRSEELLKALGIENREIKNGELKNIDAAIDWQKAEEYIKAKRQSAKDYLMER